MKDWLSGINEKIEVLFACEAGSRAWGIETDSSDYDIRFIYRYKDVKEYLSLRKARDVLEWKKPFDVIGFDLYKVCDLILKSNPTVYEWAFSPIIYQEIFPFSAELKNIISTSYSPFSLYKHYSLLKKRNVKELSKGEYNAKKQKQLIQAVRADLICKGLRNTKSIISPFEFIQKAFEYNLEILHAYETLTEAKKKQVLLSFAEVNEIISLVDSPIEIDEVLLAPKIKPSIDMIENWLMKNLRI
jgi:uncharacterized protein